MNHAELKKKALASPETLAEYSRIGAKLVLLRQMLKARQWAGSRLPKIAKRVGKKTT